ncbi:hypothetical protein KW842_25940 [Duganella sp. sic0402]|uniref:hypothetical protein n=1 Tax=Duganella sp. sic0402 TaxID=2854786 RepID=UPI001C47E4E6|nr:hypothetical protein [Duganella sp. sic0402]MBV7539216.1 hypothetical protein [Duganella sp. sic0402]
MRDLGKMGESFFSLWSSSAGMVANPSQIDRDGWDFLVEFAGESDPDDILSGIHLSSFTCKVQIKSSDNQNRKLSIKLSNLHRLATTPMPAFLVFIEFDGKESAQRVFVRHVDHDLIRVILSRVHDEEQRQERHLLHKKRLTVSYDESHMLPAVSGKALADSMRHHIGADMAAYVASKIDYLGMVGFEDGHAVVEFSSQNTEDVTKLINMSLGLGDSVEIAELVTYKKRFGKKSALPHRNDHNVRLEMPHLEPTCQGLLRCRTDKLGPSHAFQVKMYSSPFNRSVPEHYRRTRLACDFFDLIFNPFDLSQPLTFATAPSAALHARQIEIRELSRLLEFLSLLSTAGQRTRVEFLVDTKVLMTFNMTSPGMCFPLKEELAAIECGIRVLDKLRIMIPVHISLDQAWHFATRLGEMDKILNTDVLSFKLDIPPSEQLAQLRREWACLHFLTTPVGNVWIGVFAIVIGKPLLNADGGFTVYSTKKELVKTVVRSDGEQIPREDLMTAIDEIDAEYNASYDVVLAFDPRDL